MFDATKTQQALNTVANAGLVVDGKLGPATMVALLTRVTGTGRPKLATVLAPEIVSRLAAHEIDTPLRLRQLLAQACCETARFNTLVEYGDDAYFLRYEGRRDLGNVKAGDGPRFRGRGLLQTTGRANYTTLAEVTGLDCVNHPELLADPANAVEAAVRFWSAHNLNRLADAADTKGVTRVINGGLNGLVDRLTFFERLGVLQ